MPILLVMFAATIIELTVLVAVGHAIGVLATIGLLILSSLVGIALLRHEGARTLRSFIEAVRTRRPPHRELLDGMLIAAAGGFIVLPGFVSDAVGLLLLLPPVRHLVRQRMLRAASLHTPAGFTPGPVAGDGEVIDGEVIDGKVEGEVSDEPHDPRQPRPAGGEFR